MLLTCLSVLKKRSSLSLLAVIFCYIYLRQIYLKESSNPLALVDTICSEALEEFMAATGKDPRSETYPTLNK